MSDRRTKYIIRIVCPLEIEQAPIVWTEGEWNAIAIFLIQEIDISPFEGIGCKRLGDVL
jgi:hypothetical protein